MADSDRVGEFVGGLEHTPQALTHLFTTLTPDMWHYHPQSETGEKWSALDILCHLCDEEKEDFGSRLKSLWIDPEKPWAPIDPAAWVKARNYAVQDPAQKLAEFKASREASLKWLKSLDPHDVRWQNTYYHPKANLKAIDLLGAWAMHDIFHLRQLSHTIMSFYQQPSLAIDVGYAF
ncbi:MAG: DinB family protein [Deinococcales bacterium]